MQRRCPAKALVGLGDRSSKWRVVVRVAQAGYLLANRLLAVLQPPGQLAIDEGIDLPLVVRTTPEHERLRAELEAAHQSSSLPETPTARPALNDLLVRMRLRTAG